MTEKELADIDYTDSLQEMLHTLRAVCLCIWENNWHETSEIVLELEDQLFNTIEHFKNLIKEDKNHEV